jgi:hypothetical protein
VQQFRLFNSSAFSTRHSERASQVRMVTSVPLSLYSNVTTRVISPAGKIRRVKGNRLDDSCWGREFGEPCRETVFPRYIFWMRDRTATSDILRQLGPSNSWTFAVISSGASQTAKAAGSANALRVSMSDLPNSTNSPDVSATPGSHSTGDIRGNLLTRRQDILPQTPLGK